MSSQPVVVIDDDPVTVQIIADALHQQGNIDVYSFTRSKLAREFLLKQSDASVALIISDQCMPDYDGISILTLWRKKGMLTPFLLLTADATRQTVIKARQQGVTQFIAKPFKTTELISKVRYLLT
ncbi:response regulator [Salinimonas iocasae]|uniref:Response regulator n=1 Tax=Salinimonas iocasae TaxID=2572577 RepID=A0A5B7YAK3_9ALTE|nr:response regulator [Salinimonas iocasae]QCZ92674.1 response regulator [Salinimonas iocasae]